MTGSERNIQRVQVRIELEDAEDTLRALQVKAERYAQSVEQALRKIRAAAAVAPSVEDFGVESELQERLSPEEFNLLKSSGDESANVISELRQQRQIVYRLREQDARLRGVPVPA